MQNLEIKTTEESILIAQFMGYEVIDYQHNENKPIYNGNKFAKTIGEQKKLWGGLELQFTGRFTEYVKYPFSTNWSYLMPIVKQIDNKGASLIISKFFCEIGYTDPLDKNKSFDIRMSSGVKINAVYSAVIEFIKWYQITYQSNQELKELNVTN